MQSTPTSAYPVKGITLVSVSYLLERFSYYGTRSILMLYLVNNLELGKAEAAGLYGLFTGLSYFFVLLGGLLGDLAFRPVNAVIIGGALEAAGCFLLAIPDRWMAIAGMALIGLGTGFFKPNVLSQVAALYQGHKRYLDAAYAILYFAINAGAFLAPLAIGLIADTDVLIDPVGFVVAGCVALISILPWIIDYKAMNASFMLRIRQSSPVRTNGILSMIAVFLLLPVFWSIYELATYQASVCGISGSEIYFGIAAVLLTPLAAVAWSVTRMDSLYKLALGFVLLLIPVFLVAFGSPCVKAMPLLTGLPEVMVAIPALAVIARFAPVKLTGLFFSISIAMSYFANKLSFLLESLMVDHHGLATGLLVVICLVAAGMFFVLGKTLDPADRQAP